MAKIVRLPVSGNNIVTALEELLERAKQGDVVNFVFAGLCPDGNIATSWANADVGERQTLVGHLQIDVMYAVVDANMDRLLGQ